MTRLTDKGTCKAMPQLHEKGIGCALLERQAGRELQQERAEPRSKPGHLRQKAVQCGVSLLQAALVRDRPRDLDGEAEVLRHRLCCDGAKLKRRDAGRDIEALV